MPLLIPPWQVRIGRSRKLHHPAGPLLERNFRSNWLQLPHSSAPAAVKIGCAMTLQLLQRQSPKIPGAAAAPRGGGDNEDAADDAALQVRLNRLHTPHLP
ncbi:hypothetical protein NDU88_005973 [Pleurodeles waltl]|uniref:Uncharacterized protein n=1 Tax=Pleurodeles waltl TaxID=8319 RepID=A0AAV7NP13_PLEWA|nr:hypothetical protein NDU88_005973 [Pleurodeles waltl]